MAPPDDTAIAQRERAQQAWELVIAELPDDARLEAARKVVRVKRFELDALRARLPGVVRRGARVDLEPLVARLRELGVACELRRRVEGD